MAKAGWGWCGIRYVVVTAHGVRSRHGNRQVQIGAEALNETQGPSPKTPPQSRVQAKPKQRLGDSAVSALRSSGDC
jgi:hypothetical protein